MVLYNYNYNAILAAPTTTHNIHNLVNAYNTMDEQLIRAGIVPVIQQLDNEVSQIMIDAIEEKKLRY